MSSETFTPIFNSMKTQTYKTKTPTRPKNYFQFDSSFFKSKKLHKKQLLSNKSNTVVSFNQDETYEKRLSSLLKQKCKTNNPSINLNDSTPKSKSNISSHLDNPSTPQKNKATISNFKALSAQQLKKILKKRRGQTYDQKICVGQIIQYEGQKLRHKQMGKTVFIQNNGRNKRNYSVIEGSFKQRSKQKSKQKQKWPNFNSFATLGQLKQYIEKLSKNKKKNIQSQKSLLQKSSNNGQTEIFLIKVGKTGTQIDFSKMNKAKYQRKCLNKVNILKNHHKMVQKPKVFQSQKIKQHQKDYCINGWQQSNREIHQIFEEY